VAGNGLALPLGHGAVGPAYPGTRHRDGRRPQARRQGARPRPMPIATALRAYPRPARCPQRRVQLLPDDGLDRRPDAIADHALDRVAPKCLLFSLSRLPAIAPHGVILRHPPSRGPRCRSTAPDDDAFPPLFHQTPATPLLRRDELGLSAVPDAPAESSEPCWDRTSAPLPKKGSSEDRKTQ